MWNPVLRPGIKPRPSAWGACSHSGPLGKPVIGFGLSGFIFICLQVLFNFLFISSVTHWLFSSIVVTSTYLFFAFFKLQLILNLTKLWSEKVLDKIFNFLKFTKALCSTMRSMLENVPYVLENCVFCCFQMECSVHIN